MARRLFIAAALLASAVSFASSANALTITISGGESPTFPPAFTVLASGGSPVTLLPTVCCGATDSFTVSGSATGTPPLSSGHLITDTIDINSTGPGTLFLWVTETGLTSPVGTVSWKSGLTSNLLEGSISSVTLSTFLSPSDGVAPPDGTQLATATFTDVGTSVSSFVDNPGAGPYSIQEVFVVHATGAGDTNLTIDLVGTTVPELSTWAMMGLGFAFLGFVGYRTTRKPVSVEV